MEQDEWDRYTREDGLNAARGCLSAVLIALAFWALVLVGLHFCGIDL